MDLSRPPSSYEDLELWKVFVRTCELEVWQVVTRWIKRYGNPYVTPEEEEGYDDYATRQWYQQALRFCYINR